MIGKRRLAILGAALFSAACATVPQAPSELDQQPAAQALPALAQRLLDALPHDAAIWQRYMSEQGLYVSEAGDVATKAELLEGFGPFPPGLSGSIKIENPRVTEAGDVATIVFEAHEKQTVFDQSIEVDYLSSQVWHRENGHWSLLLAQAGVRARDPVPQPVALERLRDYAGNYTLSEKWPYQVEVRGTELFGGPPGRLKALIAVGDNVFAEAGNPLGVLRIFARGKGGRVDRMIQRRKYADLVWTRSGK